MLKYDLKKLHIKTLIPSNMSKTHSTATVPPSPDETDWNNAIPFVPPITSGYVTKVYDGDTITLATKLPFEASPLYKFQVRLNGIDTPELRTKNPEEKTKAQQCKAALSGLCLNRFVTLQNVALEKYGRVLADVYCDEIHLNQYMIDQGFAVKYEGGHKQTFDEAFGGSNP
jgi:micrococcal nuclease